MVEAGFRVRVKTKCLELGRRPALREAPKSLAINDGGPAERDRRYNRELSRRLFSRARPAAALKGAAYVVFLGFRRAVVRR